MKPGDKVHWDGSCELSAGTYTVTDVDGDMAHIARFHEFTFEVEDEGDVPVSELDSLQDG